MDIHQKTQIAKTISKIKGSVIRSKALTVEDLTSLPLESLEEFNLAVLNVRCVGENQENVVADPIVLSKPVTYKRDANERGDILYNFYDTLNDSICYVFTEDTYGLSWLLLYRN